jgi:hypothetical protein
MTQTELALRVEVAKDVNGIEMGVLSDGTAYLTGAGLARLCGTAKSTIYERSAEWMEGKRTGRLAQMLAEEGIEELYKVLDTPGPATYAYGEKVCMIFLAYYAFEVPRPTEQAKHAVRKLMHAGLRAFVYTALGYDPLNRLSPAWQHFHARVMLVGAPAGYFCVFNESTHLVVSAMRAGLPVDERTVPDISIGRTWSDCWKENALEEQHSPRIRHDHNYPDFFPQAASNPQPMWVYPNSALGDFRDWFQRVYVPEKLPQYLKAKVRQGLLPPSAAEMLLLSATPPSPHYLDAGDE